VGEDIRAHYQGLLSAHGDSHYSAQYSSRESQEARYTILSQVADLNGTRVLDWGCGTGHLATWLAEQGMNCRYTGVDIVPEFLEIGRQKHPEHRFGQMKDFEHESFDWILVSGVFNNRMDDNAAFFRDHVADLWKRCSKGLAFNLMSAWVDFEAPDLWYARPEEIFAQMKTLTPFVTIRNDYVVKSTSIPFEFVVYAYRQPRWRPM
jgi:SAM-dependent methyltransferase